ncbi:MAG: hypothetical protein GZ093_20550 [Rhodoferax sp.]|uniref:hypothetical protein n=1 Tax=Rhodoferax sp. TaxID=50421 RepID=UPI0013FFDBAD|nr:hypothetical protein [Rhodoferax sp.]NDP41073.1 hypothetical protein [Rhodoferax sp.]
MAQLVLPLFPSGATEITPTLSFSRVDQTVTYFHSGMPIFSHDQNERASFRYITAQLHVTAGATQAQLSRAFGVPLITIKRAVKQYRALGIKGFFAPRVTRGAAVLTANVLEQAQGQLNAGQSAIAVATELGIKTDTFTKAIRAGRLHALAKKKMPKTQVMPQSPPAALKLRRAIPASAA